MPPTAGFSAKISVLRATLKKKILSVSISLTLITTVNLYAYTKITMKSLLEKKHKKITKHKETPSLVIRTSMLRSLLMVIYGIKK
jgi:NADH:ubiquinone oxidoreductase subunit 2 (subunit N)